MTTARPPVLLLCQPLDALPLPGLNQAIQNLGIPAFLLRVSTDSSNDTSADDNDYALTLDLQDWDCATLQHAVAQLSDHYQIAGIIPPYGHSLHCRAVAQAVSHLAEEFHLPGYGSLAYDLSRNRFLLRCAWRSAALPTPDFALIHSSSQLQRIAAQLNYPVRLSPLHFALPHLNIRSLNTRDALAAQTLLTRTLTRWVLTHGPFASESGVDLRTHQPLHFELGSDLLLSTWHPSISMAFTLVIVNRSIHIVCARQILTRNQRRNTVRRKDFLVLQQLACSGVTAVGIHTGIVECQVQLTPAGPQLECIIPHYTDPRLLPVIEETTGRSFAELWLGLHTQWADHSSPIVVSVSSSCLS